MGLLIPKDTYRAQAVDAHLGYTSKGNEQVIVRFVIVGGPHDAESVVWTGFFSEACFDRTIQSLRYCGWRGDDISDLSGIDANEVDVVVDHNDYQGKVTARVAWVNQKGGLGSMSPAKAKEFAEHVKARIARMSPVEPEPEETVPF